MNKLCIEQNNLKMVFEVIKMFYIIYNIFILISELVLVIKSSPRKNE
jgi:hypothetical protein